MAKVQYEQKKSNFVFIGLIICLICLLFFGSTFALLAFQKKFDIEITLGSISLEDVGSRSLDVSNHPIGSTVCNNVYFRREPDSRNFYLRTNIYYYSPDELTVSNKKYIALLNGMIEPVVSENYKWSKREIDSYYLQTSYGEMCEIDQFVESTSSFVFLDFLTFGQGVESFLEKYSRPENLILVVEIQALQSEYIFTHPTTLAIQTAFQNHFGDVNRLDYQLVLYHDIYKEFFEFGFVEYGQKLYEPEQPQFVIGTFLNWCVNKELTTNYNFSTLVKHKLYLYAKYDINLGDVDDLYILTLNADGTYTIEQRFDAYSVPRPSGKIVFPRFYKFSTVTRIKPNGFVNNTNLTEVVISNTFHTIGDGAFDGCSSITKLYLYDSVETIGNLTFKGCTSLTEFSVPNSVTTIGAGAFRNCSGITSISLPFVGRNAKTVITPDTTSYTTYFGYIFNDTSAANFYVSSQIKVAPTITDFKVNSPTSVVTFYLPNALRTISINGGVICNFALSNVMSVSTLNVGSKVTKIGDYACVGMSSLLFLNVDESQTIDYIGSYSFNSLLSLVSVTITNNSSLYTISTGAFAYCAELVNVNLSNNAILGYIKSGVFYKCANLETIVFPSSVSTIETKAFYDCVKLQCPEFPSKLNSIASYAFYNCASFDSLDLSSTVLNTISSSAFDKDSAIRFILLPDSLTYIGDHVFASCVLITNLVIPQNVYSIGSCALEGCYRLNSLTIPFVGTSKQTSTGPIGSGTIEASSTTNDLFGNLFGTVAANTYDKYSGKYAPTRQFYYDTSGVIHNVKFFIPISLTSLIVYGGYVRIGSLSGLYTINNLVLSTGVIGIDRQALKDVIRLESISLPFLGQSGGIAEPGINTLFGYIFDSSEDVYDAMASHAAGSTELFISNECLNVKQNFGMDPLYQYFYIPASLINIIVTGGKLQYGALSGLTNITSITIEPTVLGLGEALFINSNALTTLTLGILASNAETYAPTFSTLLGFYFNKASATGYTGVTQAYSTDTANTSQTFYIPNSLRNLTVNGGKVFYGAVRGTSTAFPCIRNVSLTGHISEIGAYAFSNTIMDSLTINNLTTLTELGVHAFDGNMNLTSVKISNNVNLVSLGSYAFANCTNLGFITYVGNLALVNTGEYTFSHCSSISGVGDVISVEMKTIGAYAFEYCTGLTTIEIPSYVVIADQYAFRYCTGASSIFYNSSQFTSLSVGVFYGCSSLGTLMIGYGIQSIGAYAFSHCSGATSIVYNGMISYISDYCFEYCSSLPTITIGEYIVNVGNYAFQNCDGATSISYGQRCTQIGSFCFAYCYSLTNLLISQNITSLGDGAFYYCTGGTSITYNSVLTKVPNSCFAYCSSLPMITFGSVITEVGNSAFAYCTSATSISYIPGIVKLGQYAFSHCTGFSTLVFGADVHTAGINLFEYCTNATSVTYNSVLTYIPDYCFYYCSSLIKSTVSSQIVTIGNYAFYYCSSITDLDWTNCNVTSIGSSAFRYLSSLSYVYIPDTVTTLGSGGYNFANCVNSTKLYISRNVTTIPDNCFFANLNMAQDNGGVIYIPASVTRIGAQAFGSSSLYLFGPDDSVKYKYTKIIFEDNSQLTSIGKRAFAVSNVSVVYMTATTAPTMESVIIAGAYQFCYAPLTAIYIPSGSMSSYLGWPDESDDWFVERTDTAYVEGNGLQLYVDGQWNQSYGNNSLVSTTWNDLSGYGRNGTINTSLAWTDSGMRFNADKHVSFTTLNFTTVTLEAVLEFDTISTFTIMGNWEGGGYGIYIDSGGYLNFECFVGSYIQVKPLHVVAGKRYYISCTFDGSNMRMYESGILLGTTAISGSIGVPGSSTPFVIGGNPSGTTSSNEFKGIVNSVRIYSRALNQTEITNNYRSDLVKYSQLKTLNVRYIRDYVSASTANGANHWIEIMALDVNGNNLAKNSKAYFENNTSLLCPQLVNQNLDATEWTLPNMSGGAYKTVDLRRVCNILEIVVWHYYPDGRTYYLPKTEVSEDGVLWYSIYDSTMLGTYPEKSTGHHMNGSEMSLYVQNGLQLMVDGKWNVGVQQHQAAPNNWADLSRNSRNGTLTGTLANNWESECLNIANSGSANFGQVSLSAVTLECRITVTNTTTYQGVAGNAESGGCILEVTGGVFNWAVFVAGSYREVTFPVVANTTYNVTGVYNGSYVQLYINGTLYSQVAVTGAMGVPANNTIFAIGGNPGGSSVSSYFFGKVYTCRLYNRGLTEAEIVSNVTMDNNRYS